MCEAPHRKVDFGLSAEETVCLMAAVSNAESNPLQFVVAMSNGDDEIMNDAAVVLSGLGRAIEILNEQRVASTFAETVLGITDPEHDALRAVDLHAALDGAAPGDMMILRNLCSGDLSILGLIVSHLLNGRKANREQQQAAAERLKARFAAAVLYSAHLAEIGNDEAMKVRAGGQEAVLDLCADAVGDRMWDSETGEPAVADDMTYPPGLPGMPPPLMNYEPGQDIPIGDEHRW